MREHRWETVSPLSFDNLLDIATRLGQQGLTSFHPGKEIISYIEEWEVSHPQDIQTLNGWPTEDVTLLHLLDDWQGDFFLLAGRYHNVFQQYRAVTSYCSIAHPWQIGQPLATLQPQGWFWVGFRHTHGFIRVRLQTTDIITPGEIVDSPLEQFWFQDRRDAFQEAIHILDLPVHISHNGNQILLHTSRQDAPLFCSWPDAFGPCQFEFNSPDPFEFLVPASRLAATCQFHSSQVRIYFTGFSETALHSFQQVGTNPRLMYRCSIHCRLDEIPEIFNLLNSRGRLYGSLAEFQTEKVLPNERDAAAIVGFVGSEGQFRLEIRLNRHPLEHQETERWLEQLVGYPLLYSPLPAFP